MILKFIHNCTIYCIERTANTEVMAILPILVTPNPILRKKAAFVPMVDNAIKKLNSGKSLEEYSADFKFEELESNKLYEKLSDNDFTT